MIDEGRLSAGHGRALVSANDLRKLVKIILKRKLNVRQTEQLVKKENSEKNQFKSKKLVKDADTLALERDISNTLGLKVEIQFNDGRGTLKIKYNSLSQLDDILARLSRKQKSVRVN